MVRAVEESYAEGVTDEFIKPIVNDTVDGRIGAGHVVIFGEDAGAAPGVGVTAVHEAVQIHLVETIRFRGVAEGVEMIER